MRSPAFIRTVVALVAVAGVLLALFRLHGFSTGITIEHKLIGTTPATVFQPHSPTGASTASRSVPAVVVAHGFAGSQQLMLPFATTLARAGFVVLTFDFPGHGRNRTPLAGGLDNSVMMAEALGAVLGEVVAHARQFGPSVALLGHSMAAETVVRYASAHRDIAATVAVSLFFPANEQTVRPRNLLIVDGALEPAALRDQGRAMLGDPVVSGSDASGNARAGVTYGDIADGSARRMIEAEGVEHISVLYSRDAIAEARDWLRASSATIAPAAPASNPPADRYGPWLGFLLLSVVILGRSLSSLLPLVATRATATSSPTRSSTRSSTHQRWTWRHAAAIAGPALITPAVVANVPGGWFPILLGDYLLLHFALYGALTLVALRLTTSDGRAARSVIADVAQRFFARRFFFAASACLLFSVMAIGVPIDAWVFNLQPTPERIALIVALACATSVWFAGDELLTHGPGAPRGAYPASKVAFLLSLVLAIALDPARLFFLAIIAPAILLLFVVYGLFSRWILRRTGEPLVAAVANAIIFAWFLGAAFPVVR